MVDLIKNLDHQVIDLDQLESNSDNWLVLEFLAELSAQNLLVVQNLDPNIITTRQAVEQTQQIVEIREYLSLGKPVLRLNTSSIPNKPIYLKSGKPISKLMINFRTKTQVKLFWMHTSSSQKRQLVANLLSPGIQLELYCPTYIKETEVIENRLEIRHLAGNCRSYTLFKSVLEGYGRFSFFGKIYVSAEAHQTDAELLNHNVILSNTALVTSKPELEIFCDDVECRHGATIGNFNSDQDFYLQTRGIPQPVRHALLTEAFLGEIATKMRA